MKLYADRCEAFFAEVDSGRIEDRLAEEFRRNLGRRAPDAERTAWRNSLAALSEVCQRAELADQGIIIEYQLPQSSQRLDVMLTGVADDGHDAAAILELKQWQKTRPADGEGILTWVGGMERDVLHPSVQVGQYHRYVGNFQTVFHEGDDPVRLSAAAYLHNYAFDAGDPLLAPKFRDVVSDFPIFAAEDGDELSGYLARTIGRGSGDVLDRVLKSETRPSKKLMDEVGAMLDGEDDYVLLDEQKVAFDRVVAAVTGASDDRGLTVIVHGGPGTGKSVIAVNLLSWAHRNGIGAQHATGSKAFTKSLERVAGGKAKGLFKYFNNYTQCKPGEFPLIICDEGHRIRTTSNGRWTKRSERSDIPQIDELIRASKTIVVFIDEAQGVRPFEIGRADLIKAASDAVARPWVEYRLTTQFRCGGSDAYVNWVASMLELEEGESPVWRGNPDFTFTLVESSHELGRWVENRVEEGYSARVVAGFCWPWSNPLADGTLVDDVVIGNWSRPWNARSDKGRLARGIPKEHEWATAPEGIGQVGCIYTAQGFEFDYAGVIFGTDLVYREAEGGWVARPEASYDRMAKQRKKGEDDDGAVFTRLVKQTYRVLLTRGMKGCAVYFLDDETREHVQSLVP